MLHLPHVNIKTPLHLLCHDVQGSPQSTQHKALSASVCVTVLDSHYRTAGDLP